MGTSIRFDQKYWQDTVWNYVSFGIQAAAGCAINAIILLWLGTGSLGVFNQIYAIFVTCGQISVLGLHDSALKHASEFSDRSDEFQLLSIAALAVSVLAGFVGAVLLALSSGVIGHVFQSPDVGRGVLLVAPGLFLFTINKVLMAILNGQRRMVAFALGQSIRAVAVFMACYFIVVQKREPYEFGACFTIAEVILFLPLFLILRPVKLRLPKFSDMRFWMVRHIRFGSLALVHGFLSEAYIRIDIIMLGIFLSDRLVGVYSFASMFLEGVYQVPIVIRNITNPILVKLLIAQDRQAFVNYTRRTAFLSLVATLITSTGVLLIYPYLSFIAPQEVIGSSYIILLTLLAGLLVFSICIPFDYIFLQAGRPGIQSIYMTINILVNVLLNFLFIPHWGLYGAGIATALAFIISGILLNVFTVAVLGLPGGLFLKH